MLLEQSIAREAQSSLEARKDSSVSVTMFEIQGSKALDLVSSRDKLTIEEDAEHGDWLRVSFFTTTRGHCKILIKGVRNTHGTCLIVGNDGNCKGLRY